MGTTFTCPSYRGVRLDRVERIVYLSWSEIVYCHPLVSIGNLMFLYKIVLFGTKA